MQPITLNDFFFTSTVGLFSDDPPGVPYFLLGEPFRFGYDFHLDRQEALGKITA